MKRKVLITGGAGYLGTVLVRRLLKAGYLIRVLDNLAHGVDAVRSLKGVEFIKGDIRDLDLLEFSMKGAGAIVHLAALVGDRACQDRPNEAQEINFYATLRLVDLAANRVERFIYPSTCSIYGRSTESEVNENSCPNPISLYAKTKVASEDLLKYACDHFTPCVLRLATLYGISPRMRFDLLINEFTLQAFQNKEIWIYAGERWRPFLHVEDAARAIQLCLEAPTSKINGRIFNVGAGGENYNIPDLKGIFEAVIPEARVCFTHRFKDVRSYKVSFKRVEKELNFTNKLVVKKGIKEIYRALTQGNFRDHQSQKYYNHRISE